MMNSSDSLKGLPFYLHGHDGGLNVRTLLVKIVRTIKGDNTWSLDSEVTLSAFLSMLAGALGKSLRGTFGRIGLKSCSGLLLVGRHARLRNKQYISFGRGVVVEEYAEIQGISKKGIMFGDRVSVGSYAMIRPSGYYSGHIGEGLTVGDKSTIGPFCYIGCSGHISIGRNVMIGPRVSMYAENHNFADVSTPMQHQGVRPEPIIIEDDCWIASHAVILAGVTVGHGSIVAAGSVVSNNVPPYSVVAGMPARIIKSRLSGQPTLSAYASNATGSKSSDQ